MNIPQMRTQSIAESIQRHHSIKSVYAPNAENLRFQLYELGFNKETVDQLPKRVNNLEQALEKVMKNDQGLYKHAFVNRRMSINNKVLVCNICGEPQSAHAPPPDF